MDAVAEELDANPRAKVMAVNVANNLQAGGDYKMGSSIHEADMFRRSTLAYALDSPQAASLYPINNDVNEDNAIFTPNINIIRKSGKDRFGFLQEDKMKAYTFSVFVQCQVTTVILWKSCPQMHLA